MRIAFFLDRFPIVSETFVIRQVAGLKRLGHEVVVISMSPGDGGVKHRWFCDQALAENICAVHRSRNVLFLLMNFLVLIAKVPGSLSARVRLMALMRAIRSGNWASTLDLLAVFPDLPGFDVIISHFGTVGVRAMILREAGVLQGRLVTVFHGADISVHGLLKRYKSSYRRLLQETDMQLAVSKLWVERLREMAAGAGNIRVLHMGVDVADVPLRPHKELSRPLRVLCVGRFTEKKAQIDAISAIKACHSDVSLRLIGSGEMEMKLRDAAAGDPRIVFLGKKSQQEVFEELFEADIFLLPSVTASNGDMEGIPVALMEAMAVGVVVLSTRHSGIPELVDDGVSGFLVREHDVKAITSVLDSLARGDHDLDAVRRAAREKIVREFDNEALDYELEGVCLCLSGKST